MKLKDVRAQPLLQSPPAESASKWEEIDGRRAKGMRASLKWESDNFMNPTLFAQQAWHMKTLGFDVKSDVRSCKYVKDGIEINERDGRSWDRLATHLAFMKRLGFTVGGHARTHEKDMRGFLDGYAERGDWWRFTWLASDMKTLGLDVSKQVAKHKAELSSELGKKAGINYLWWVNYATQAARMKNLGIDVSAPVSLFAPELRKVLDNIDADGRWDDFAHHAANLAELGLLTPRVKPSAEEALPPLKRFAR